ncbi:hypothetical protein ACWJJH_03080 [Endozoicomonadaceae bacterium StTr2]
MTLQYLSDSWHFYKANFLKILSIFLPYFLLTELISAVQGKITPEEQLLTLSGILVFLFSAVLFQLCQGALIAYLSSAVSGETLSPINAFRISRRFLVSMIAIYLIIYTLSGIAFAFLIIPGLIVWIKFAFSEFYCILENSKAVESVKKSWPATKPCFWLLVKGQFLIMLVTMAPAIALINFDIADTVTGSIINFLVGIYFWLAFPMSTIYAFRLFCTQRAGLQNDNS